MRSQWYGWTGDILVSIGIIWTNWTKSHFYSNGPIKNYIRDQYSGYKYAICGTKCTLLGIFSPSTMNKMKYIYIYLYLSICNYT